MELDDLKSPICSWSSLTPNVPLSEIHIAVWEKVSAAFNSLLPPATKEISTTELKTNFKAKLAQDARLAKTSSMPLLSIDCNVSNTSSQDIDKALHSPPLQSPMLSPSRSRTALNLPLKTRSGQFEPYIPRKKRLVSQSCPNSPVCNNSRADSDGIATHLASPLSLSQPFLTWQDIKEQNKKLSVDDLQSDSGYSSPASVSSCGSLVTGQSNFATSVNERLENLHDNCNVKQNIGGQTDHLNDASLTCDNYDSSSKGCLSHRKSTDLIREVDSLDLADKLEQLLPDCLLGNPRDFVKCGTTDAMETKLEDIGKLSADQDQFILDLLAM